MWGNLFKLNVYTVFIFILIVIKKMSYLRYRYFKVYENYIHSLIMLKLLFRGQWNDGGAKLVCMVVTNIVTRKLSHKEKSDSVLGRLLLVNQRIMLWSLESSLR